MPSLGSRRLMLIAVAGLLPAAAGGAAIADPDGAARVLKPTAQLAQSGGVAAPAPVSGGGVSAPAAGGSAPQPVARTAPPELPAPAPPPEAPEQPVSDPIAAGDPEAEPPAQMPAAPTAPEPMETRTEPEPTESEPAPGDAPSPADALGAAEAPLVPAALLPTEVEEDSPPLIDISPAYVAAEPLQSQGDLTTGAAQTDVGEEGEEDDEDEVIIPIPPADFDDGDQTPTEPNPTETPTEPAPTALQRGAGLPSTGRALAGPGLTAVLLLFAGAALRLAAANAPTARA